MLFCSQYPYQCSLVERDSDCWTMRVKTPSSKFGFGYVWVNQDVGFK